MSITYNPIKPLIRQPTSLWLPTVKYTNKKHDFFQKKSSNSIIQLNIHHNLFAEFSFSYFFLNKKTFNKEFLFKMFRKNGRDLRRKIVHYRLDCYFCNPDTVLGLQKQQSRYRIFFK
jgi:hypothetical protein